MRALLLWSAFVASLFKEFNACPLNAYAFTGSPSCSTCTPPSTFVSATQTCAPSASSGPSDTVFYLSCDASEDVGAFASPVPSGLTFVVDRGNHSGAALSFSSGAILSAPPTATLPLPTGASPRTIAMWVNCPLACPSYAPRIFVR